MGSLQTSLWRNSRLDAVGQCGLPAGVRQIDCDGPADLLSDAGGSGLWNACDPSEQERISTCFVEIHSDLIRDALLDAQDSPRPPPTGSNRGRGDLRGELLGGALWPRWIRFRDQALREMHQRGELT